MGEVDETYMSLEAPANTPDPAATPLTLRFADDERRRIKRVRVFIDNNPSPLVATFDFGSTPITEINMRVRVDRFTSVRAIAETADGGLEMRSSWVKASGGCSAPPSAAEGGVLGEIRVRSAADAKSVQINIRHPNASGFQIDPRTGDPIPAHFISRIQVNAGGSPLLTAQTGISLSENPALRIVSDKLLPAPITVDAVDSVTQAHYTASTPAGAADTFNLSEPAPGVFVHRGSPLALDAPGHDDIANIGFIAGRNCVAVVDTGGSVSVGRKLRAAVAKHSSAPICYVINTHVHVDHVLGNAAFNADHPSFVGHAALPDAMARSRDFFVKQYAGDMDPPASAAQVVGPDRLVAQEITLDLGGRLLVLRAWPKAHTDCDLTVYDVRTGTVWTGDLLFTDRLPALDGSLKGWLAVLDQLSHVKVKLVVPGHGPLSHDLAASIVPERRYLQSLMDGVRGELADGKPPEDAIKRVALAEKSQWLLWDEVHPRNVLRAYQELEWN